jgi:hypothetical protein
MNRLLYCCLAVAQFLCTRVAYAAQMRGCMLFLVCCIGSADAAIFQRDWKAPGDGLLTYDDVNQRVWLDVTESQLSKFPEPRLDNALAELAPGGMFNGFTFAKRNDVFALAQSAGIDTRICWDAHFKARNRAVRLRQLD